MTLFNISREQFVDRFMSGSTFDPISPAFLLNRLEENGIQVNDRSILDVRADEAGQYILKQYFELVRAIYDSSSRTKLGTDDLAVLKTWHTAIQILDSVSVANLAGRSDVNLESCLSKHDIKINILSNF